MPKILEHRGASIRVRQLGDGYWYWTVERMPAGVAVPDEVPDSPRALSMGGAEAAARTFVDAAIGAAS